MINVYISMKFIYLSRSGVIMKKVSVTLFFDTPMYFVFIKRTIIYFSCNLHSLNSHPLILGLSSRLCNWLVNIGSYIHTCLHIVLGLMFHARDFFLTDGERLPCDRIL